MTLSPDDTLYLAATQLPGVGPATLAKLRAQFPHMLDAVQAQPAQLQALGLNGEAQQRWRAFAEGRQDALKRSVDAALAWAEQPNHHLLFPHHGHYPALLQELYDPPPLLFMRGQPDCLHRPQVAVVGSRRCSRSGAQAATEMAHALAEAGWCVTSGLASGIDGHAHRAALAKGGYTVAVMATGIDRVYPSAHAYLADAIAEQGALVTEFALGVKPKPGHFPRRNRIISGLSNATLVVEASIKSGSLVTARCALEQGREVLAVPGSIFNGQAAGCHQLIRDGAALIDSPQTLLQQVHADQAIWQAARQPVASLTDHPLLQAIGYEPTPVDAIVAATGLAPAELSGLLMELEMKGLIEGTLGGFQRVV